MINRIYYGWWIVLASFSFAAYVGGTVFFGFTAFFEPIFEEFGWSYAQISFVITLRGLEMGIFAPIVGVLVDRFGSRKLAIFGAVTIGIGLIVLSRSNSLLSFYGAFVIIGFGAGGCTSVVLMTAVANWFKKNIGKALGIMACGFGAGGFLVPVVVWLIAHYGWRTALVVIGVTMWCVGIPLAFVIRNNPAQHGGLPPQEQLPDEKDGSGKEVVLEEVEFKVAAKSVDFWYMNFAEAIRMMVLTSVVTHVMPYLTSIGVSTYTAGFVAGGIPLASIIGRFGFGWLSDIFEKRRVMVMTYSCMCIGMIAFSNAHHTWLIIPFLLFFSPGFGGSMILRGAVLREYFGVGSFGKLLGITMGTASLGGMLGPLIVGHLYDVTGEYRPIWIGGCFVVALSVLFAARIKSSYRWKRLHAA